MTLGIRVLRALRRMRAVSLPLLVALGAATLGAQEAVTGTLLAQWGDPRVGLSPRLSWMLADDRGQAITVEIPQSVLDAAGGVRQLDRHRVSAAGLRVTRSTVGQPAYEVLQATSVRPLAALGFGAGVAAAGAGAQPYAILLCKFSDVVAEPGTASDYTTLFGNSYPNLDHYFRELSANQMSLAGTQAFGWFTLPQPRSFYINGSGVPKLAALAQDCAAAADASVNFNAFVGIGAQFNSTLDDAPGGGFSWGGGAAVTVEGQLQSFPFAWMASWAAVGQGSRYGGWAHEIGHTLGLPHSSGPYAATYDSRWDVMSNAYPKFQPAVGASVPQHTIGFHKDMLGWLSGRKVTVSIPGTETVTLEQLAFPPGNGNPLMIEIPIPNSPTFDYYTVEARRLDGYDAALPGEAVIIHRVSNGYARVVDPDNNGNPNDNGAMWLTGETFDDGAGVQVAVGARTADGWTVTVTVVGTQLPNLRANGMGWDPGTTTIPFTFYGFVENNGPIATTNVGYRLLVDGTPRATGVIAALAAGATIHVAIPSILISQAGPHVVAFELDPAGAIAEAVETDNIYTVNIQVVAQTFSLAVFALPGSGSGTVTATGINCTLSNGDETGDCTETFDDGTVVTLTQTPSANATFVGWGGSCTGTGACQVTMSQHRTVLASYTLTTATHLLTVTASASAGSGAVTATGISCAINNGSATGDCSESYAAGTLITLTQTPTAGHTFAGWGGSCAGTGGCQVGMSQARTVSAGFTPPVVTHLLTISAGAGAGSGTVTATGISCTISNGATTGDCTEGYATGTIVTLTQTPTAGHTFAGWGGSCAGAGACQVTMSQGRTVSAGFTPPPVATHPLTITAGTGAGSGAVTATGITCAINNGGATGDCSESYTEGTLVTLTHTPTAGHTFAGWGGSCTGTGACQVTMSQARTVSASFTPPPVVTHLLTITAGAGAGSGAVTAAGIDCAINNGSATGDCSESYTEGTLVTLTPSPTAGHTFSGWGGPCAGAGGCQVTMSQARTVSAGFTPPPLATHLLTITASAGAGSGTVTATGINCAINNGSATGDCSESYTEGTLVTLTPSPTAGHAFSGWGGSCAGAGACQVTMSQARTVSAGFTPPAVTTHLLTITAAAGTGSGTVTATGINCAISNGTATGDCSESYTEGTLVTLTQASAAGHAFAGWGSACAGMGACAVTMSTTRTVTAAFSQLNVPQLALRVVDVLLGNGALTVAEQAWLDAQGNNNGRVDLGDLLALLDRNPSVTLQFDARSNLDRLLLHQTAASREVRR